MAFLPIVERELRVAARKRSSFWVRIVAALLAFALGAGFIIVNRVGPGLGAASLGAGLFATLTWLCLVVALAAGLFLTSDCISDEKRAGTIGFLFLTDLRGYDVVLGKLLATSLRGLSALLGVLPILAITLVMGGVTGDQFWRTSLALLNALVLSLAVGLIVSVRCRESHVALGGTLFVLIALAALGPITDEISAWIGKTAVAPLWMLSSPGYLFVAAGAWGRSPFWTALMVNQAIVWILLILASVLLPGTWQERPGRSAASSKMAFRWKFGAPKRRARLRKVLMDVNPVCWLVCRERWQGASVWFMTVLLAGVAGVIFFSAKSFILWNAWGMTIGLLTLLLYLGFAVQSARFFVEAQHTGFMELLLVSPLTVAQIIQGQWRALMKMLGLPITLFLLAECVGGFAAQERAWRQMSTAVPPAATAPGTNAPPVTSPGSKPTVTMKSGALNGMTFSGPGFTLPAHAMLLTIAITSTCALLANFVTLVWFGMWMGLTSKTLNLATLKTVVFVQIVPWFVLSFASAVAIPVLLIPTLMKGKAVGPQLMMWFPWIASILATVLSLAKDVVFSLWARRKLYSEFRVRAMHALAPIRSMQPPILPSLTSQQRSEQPEDAVAQLDRK